MSALALRIFCQFGSAAFAALAALRHGSETETWVTSWWALAAIAGIFLAAGSWAAVADHHMQLIAARRRRNRPKPQLFDQDTVEYVQVVA